jgi:hypothetical protein
MSDPKRYELYVDASLQAEEGGEWVKWDDYAELQSQVERLTKAGDAMADEIRFFYRENFLHPSDSHSINAWCAAKEGKQP